MRTKKKQQKASDTQLATCAVFCESNGPTRMVASMRRPSTYIGLHCNQELRVTVDDRGPRSSQQNGRNQKQGSRNQYRGTGTKVGGEASNVRETPIRRGRAYWEALFRSFYRLGILNPGIGCVIGAQRDFSYYCYYVHGALFGLLYLQYRLNKFSKMNGAITPVVAHVYRYYDGSDAHARQDEAIPRDRIRHDTKSDYLPTSVCRMISRSMPPK
uniref:AlNc14C236G9383 protein n=1 Tax=Albugo laibachii Nc14 TaxID=890382 RepID=F0W8D9_9STRA|nr:AlNc14C34G3070 [Albugo laibachii Nc14]CCA24365.1 AlNc14C236G9383 [Albugo laibachii Nc14]|eukprot:CCA24365.1 AlNc14C236G9383 [Albugo laibachii Nc14]